MSVANTPLANVRPSKREREAVEKVFAKRTTNGPKEDLMLELRMKMPKKIKDEKDHRFQAMLVAKLARKLKDKIDPENECENEKQYYDLAVRFLNRKDGEGKAWMMSMFEDHRKQAQSGSINTAGDQIPSNGGPNQRPTVAGIAAVEQQGTTAGGTEVRQSPMPAGQGTLQQPRGDNNVAGDAASGTRMARTMTESVAGARAHHMVPVTRNTPGYGTMVALRGGEAHRQRRYSDGQISSLNQFAFCLSCKLVHETWYGGPFATVTPTDQAHIGGAPHGVSPGAVRVPERNQQVNWQQRFAADFFVLLRYLAAFSFCMMLAKSVSAEPSP